MKTTQRKTDQLFSLYIRRRDNFTCQWCRTRFTPDNGQGLDCAHYHTRNHENVRFDEDNCLSLCALRCHRWLDEHKTEFDAFMVKRLGSRRWDLLALRAHMYKKRDDKADKIIIQDMLAKQAEQMLLEV